MTNISSRPAPVTPRQSGIYQLTCGAGVYYGATSDFAARVQRHRTELQQGTHHNYRLQALWNEHHQLDAQLLEHCPPGALSEREQFYLDHYPDSLNIDRLSSLSPDPRLRFSRRSEPKVGGRPASRPQLLPRVNQRDAEHALLGALLRGETRGMYKSPCGTGKTRMAAMFGAHFHRCLYITHYDNLLATTLESLKDTWPGHHIGIIKGQEHSVGPKWTLASIQTLVRRLDDLPADLFDLVICDEAHLFGSSGGQKILDHFRPLYVAGFTATPERHSGRPLPQLFGRIVYNMTVPEALEQGLVVPLRGLDVQLDLSRVETATGEQCEFDGQQVSTLMRSPQALQETARIIHEQRGKRRTLVYAADCEHAHALGQALGAGAVVATSHEKDAQRKIDAFKAGQGEFLISVDMLSYGFDCPEASCVVLALMTRSAVRFSQIVGRGMRTAPGKHDTLVIDFGGNLRRGLKVEQDWVFHIDRLRPSNQAPQDRTGRLPEAPASDDIDWNQSSFTAVGYCQDVPLLRVAPAMSYHDPNPSLSLPPTENQWLRLKQWGYQASPHLSRQQIARLIAAQPATPGQREELRLLGYDDRPERWRRMHADQIIKAAQAELSELRQQQLKYRQQLRGPQHTGKAS